MYEILNVEETPLELRHNWVDIMRRLYAEKPQYFPSTHVKRFTDTGIFYKL